MHRTAITNTTATLLVRSGLENDLDESKLRPGEWAVSTDAKYVRMCFAQGHVYRMATYESFESDLAIVQQILSDCQDIQVAVTALEALAQQHADAAALSAQAAAQSASQAGQYISQEQEYVESCADSAQTATEKATEATQAAQTAAETTAQEILSNGVPNADIAFSDTTETVEQAIAGMTTGSKLKTLVSHIKAFMTGAKALIDLCVTTGQIAQNNVNDADKIPSSAAMYAGLNGKANSDHNHDTRYNTKTEVTNMLANKVNKSAVTGQNVNNANTIPNSALLYALNTALTNMFEWKSMGTKRGKSIFELSGVTYNDLYVIAWYGTYNHSALIPKRTIVDRPNSYRTLTARIYVSDGNDHGATVYVGSNNIRLDELIADRVNYTDSSYTTVYYR